MAYRVDVVISRSWLLLFALQLTLSLDCRASDATAFSTYVNSLDATKPESVCQAAARLRTAMPNEQTPERAEMFRRFREFQEQVGSDSTPAFYTASDPFRTELSGYEANLSGLKALLKKRPDIQKAVGAWFDCGFSTITPEGQLSLIEDPAPLLEFVNQIPRDLGEYIRFAATENATRIVEDAGLLISWEQLRARIARWEQFARAHPKLAETTTEVEPEIERLTSFFLCGMDNSHTWNLPSGLVDREVNAAWKRYAKLNHDSPSRRQVAALLPVIEANRGKLTEAQWGKLSVCQEPNK